MAGPSSTQNTRFSPILRDSMLGRVGRQLCRSLTGEAPLVSAVACLRHRPLPCVLGEIGLDESTHRLWGL